jgi:DNA-binding MarR family transcriptional regulator
MGTEAPSGLGPALRRAWVGYRRRLDAEMERAGFADGGFPDGRVLRICARGANVTIAGIGRELGITRQGAAKIVTSLRQRHYVSVQPSPRDAREKVVVLTPRAQSYLEAHRKAARRIEAQLRRQVGAEAFEALGALLEALGGDD